MDSIGTFWISRLEEYLYKRLSIYYHNLDLVDVAFDS